MNRGYHYRPHGKNVLARVVAQIAADAGKHVLFVDRKGARVVKPSSENDPDGPVGKCAHITSREHRGKLHFCLHCVTMFCDDCAAQHGELREVGVR